MKFFLSLLQILSVCLVAQNSDLPVPNPLPPSFEKGSQVRLTRPAPLYFKQEVHHDGNVGDTLTVLAYSPASQKVFVEFASATGIIALSVTQDAVVLVPTDAKASLTLIRATKGRNEYDRAEAIAKSLAASFPGESSYSDLLKNIVALKAAHLEAATARRTLLAVKARAEQLRKNAVVAARPNRLNRGDVSGTARAEAEWNKANQAEADATTKLNDADGVRRDQDDRLSSLLATLLNEPVRAGATSIVRNEAIDGGDSKQNAFDILSEKLHAQDGMRVSEYTPGKSYALLATRIIQAGDGFILLQSQYTKEPFAILQTTAMPNLANVRLEPTWFAQALGNFIEFRSLTFTSGASQRLPVFSAQALRVPETGKTFLAPETND